MDSREVLLDRDLAALFKIYDCMRSADPKIKLL